MGMEARNCFMYQEKIGLVHYEMNKLENTGACGTDKRLFSNLSDLWAGRESKISY